jgi:hypothetical protein
MEPAEEAAPEVEPAAPAEDMPDWLAAEISEEEEIIVPELEPDFVEELAPDFAPALEEPEIESAEMPAWLSEPAEAELEEADIPDWLSEPGEAELEKAEVPDWLTEPADEVDLEQVEVPDWLSEPDEAEIEPARVPDWLAAPAGAEAIEAPLEEGLAQADIPDWLQAMRPSADAAEEPEQEEEVETEGLLAGLAGVVTPASVITAPPEIRRKRRAVRDEAMMARARLWQKIIAQASQPSPISLPKPKADTARQKFERRLIYILLALAVIAPIFMGVNPFSDEKALSQDAGIAFGLIETGIGPDTPVLLAFDYDPASLGEVHLQAQIIVDHLIRREAKILVVSLTPEGATLAQQILEDKEYSKFVNLGYLPGQAVGVRSLETVSLWGNGFAFDGEATEDIPALNDLDKLSDVSWVVILTANQNHVQWWVEQMTLLDLDESISLIAGVSAAVEPLVRPYYESDPKQIDGLISGVAGAADYEMALGQDEGPATQILGGQFVGQLVVLALILLGMVVHGLGGLGRTV